jgi:hypothetical protein
MSATVIGNEIVVCIACDEEIEPEDDRAIFELDASLCGDCVKEFHCRGCATNCEYKLEKIAGKRRCELSSADLKEEMTPSQ